MFPNLVHMSLFYFCGKIHLQKSPHHVDLVDMIPKNNFYSKLNRGTNHFQSNLVFKIISIKNYEVLFSHEINKVGLFK